MSKKILIINLHSVIDVITNSSSELFVIDNSKSIESIKEMLTLMLHYWNEMAADGIFGDHYVKNKQYSFKDNKINNEHEPILNYEDVFGDIYVYTKEKYDNRGQYSDDRYETETNIGKIFIESSTDNSIPSEMFEWIESAFGYRTERFHLG